MLTPTKLAPDPRHLDNPIAASFAHAWAPFAERVGSAWILPETISPFVAAPPSTHRPDIAFADRLKARSGPALVLSADEIAVPAGLQIIRRQRGVQMIRTRKVYGDCPHTFIRLKERDAIDMLALARLTKPGPFERATHQLGEFIGIRVDGQLVAMAGQRMAFPGCTEISAVCVHPDHRGRGYAQSLISAMTRKLEQGAITPFLHTYSDNQNAISLYEYLGFEIRCEMNIAMLANPK